MDWWMYDGGAPRPQPDGSWLIMQLFHGRSAFNGPSQASYKHLSETTRCYAPCTKESPAGCVAHGASALHPDPAKVETINQEPQPVGWTYAFPGDAFDLKSADSNFFSKELETTVAAEAVCTSAKIVKVKWAYTIRRIGKCRVSNSIPIVDDPNRPNKDINDEDVEMQVVKGADGIDPDNGIANLKIRVTCDQVPVKNAVVVVGVEAKKNTGGHMHDTGERRPRGSLKGIELTDVLPEIHLRTGDDGSVHQRINRIDQPLITFEPGKAVSCPGLRTNNCDNIGIAGIYRITATSERFPMRKAEVAVEAKVDGLSPIDANPNYVDDTGGSAHNSGDNATATTKQQLVKFASAFHDLQKAHNAELAACQTPEWPTPQWTIYPLWVIDVSLPFGGLYDLGPDQGGAYWSTPHQTHGRGDGVDFAAHRRYKSQSSGTKWPTDKVQLPICDGYKISPQGYLMMKMSELGEPSEPGAPRYGTWDKTDFSADSQPWHLHFDQ